jgi:predicted small integral membrane protein
MMHLFREGGIIMLRAMKIGLITTVALWGLVGALGNLLDWNQALGAVTAVTSMATFDGGAESWQATTNPVVIWLGALFIMLSKLAVGIMCTVGVMRMWQSRRSTGPDFAASKAIALSGCAVAVIMLFGGFIVIAESWFELWRSQGPIRMALPDAFRYAGMIALIAIFVAMPDE